MEFRVVLVVLTTTVSCVHSDSVANDIGEEVLIPNKNMELEDRKKDSDVQTKLPHVYDSHDLNSLNSPYARVKRNHSVNFVSPELNVSLHAKNPQTPPPSVQSAPLPSPQRLGQWPFLQASPLSWPLVTPPSGDWSQIQSPSLSSHITPESHQHLSKPEIFQPLYQYNIISNSTVYQLSHPIFSLFPWGALTRYQLPYFTPEPPVYQLSPNHVHHPSSPIEDQAGSNSFIKTSMAQQELSSSTKTPETQQELSSSIKTPVTQESSSSIKTPVTQELSSFIQTPVTQEESSSSTKSTVTQQELSSSIKTPVTQELSSSIQTPVTQEESSSSTKTTVTQQEPSSFIETPVIQPVSIITPDKSEGHLDSANDKYKIHTGYIKNNEKKYSLHTNEKVNWFSALKTCALQGKRLATIENKEEYDKLLKFLNNSSRSLTDVWVAGSDLCNEGTFTWMSTGKPVTYTDWDNNINKQPDDWDCNEDCIHVHKYADYGFRLNDMDCYEDYYFVCEYF